MIKPVYLLFICLNFFESFSDAFNIAAGSVTPRRDSMIPIYSTPNDEMEGARHTYVEGEVYDDIFAEIEAMGGDPSFLDDDDVREMRMAQAEKVVEPEKLGGSAASIFQSVAALERFATDGKGPSPMKKDNNPSEPKSPDWEWDGIVDEDAHMGWD